jgi:hypothetical protein
MLNWARNNTGILLLLLIMIAFFLADGIHVIDYPPRSVHQWRQSDCVAYSRNYYYRNLGLFTPSYYNLVSKDGRSVSEFPIIYYAAGKLYHIFGVHYWILRGLTFCCYLIGLLYLFKIAKLWLKEPILQLFTVIVIATTPFYYYYALNTLPNVPAISFSFAGLYFMIRYQQSNNKYHLVIATLFFILSSLLKPTDGGLIWLAYAGVIGTNFLLKKQKDRISGNIFISVAIILISVCVWYIYATWYNAVNNNVLNLLGIFPIWDMTYREIFYVIVRRVMGLWLSSYQYLYILLLLLPLLVIYIVKWGALHRFLRIFSLYLISGAAIYNILWFNAFGDHDYYQLINVIPPVFLFITIAEYFERILLAKIKRKTWYFIEVALLFAMFASILHNKDLQHYRYTKPVFIYAPTTVYQVTPYLRKIGVAATDTVVSVPDPSPNITLTAFGNLGYTPELRAIGVHNVDFCRQHGAKYMIITDSNYIHNPAYQPYTSKMIGKYKGIFIYDIR